MKAIRIAKPRKAEIIDLPEPQIMNSFDVKIKVAFAGICIDDLPLFRHETSMLAFPMLFHAAGHEMSGTVVEVGDSAKRVGVKKGDRVSGYAWKYCGECVYCRTGKENHCLNIKMVSGTMAEYVVWNAKRLWRLPESASLEEGVLTDPLGYCLYGMDKLNIKPGSKVMIIGATAMGLILLQLAKLNGATHLTLVESVESKKQLAFQLGAEYVIDPVQQSIASSALKITKHMGYDAIIETSVNPDMLSVAAKLVARQGYLSYTNVYGLDYQCPIQLSELYLKEATLKPFYLAPNNLLQAMNIMPKINLKPIITKVFDMDNVTRAFETFEAGLDPKILIRI